MSTLLLALLTGLRPAVACLEQVERVDELYDLRLRQAVLPSGLQLLAETDDHATCTSVAVFVGAGRADDPPGTEGLAELFQWHAQARLDDLHPEGVLADTVTADDYVRMSVQGGPHQLPQLITAVSHILTEPGRGYDVETHAELLAVVRARRAALVPDTWGRRAAQLLDQLFPPGHPYRALGRATTYPADIPFETARAHMSRPVSPRMLTIVAIAPNGAYLAPGDDGAGAPQRQRTHPLGPFVAHLDPTLFHPALTPADRTTLGELGDPSGDPSDAWYPDPDFPGEPLRAGYAPRTRVLGFDPEPPVPPGPPVGAEPASGDVQALLVGWTLPSGYRHPLGLTHLAAILTEQGLHRAMPRRWFADGGSTCAAVDSVRASVLVCHMPLRAPGRAHAIVRALRHFSPGVGLSPAQLRDATRLASMRLFHAFPIAPPGPHTRAALTVQVAHFTGQANFFGTHLDGYTAAERRVASHLDRYVVPPRMVVALTDETAASAATETPAPTDGTTGPAY